MNGSFDVLGIGVVTVDDLIYVPHYPASDTKVAVQKEIRTCGGLVGTALATAARMQASAAYFGVLGQDDLSAYVRREFEQEGVECALILPRPGAKPVHAIIVVDQSNGQRTIFHSVEYGFIPRPDEITAGLVARCRVLLIDQSTGSSGIAAAGIAHGLHIPVVGDFERESEAHITNLIETTDHLIVGSGFGGRITGEMDPVRMVRAFAQPSRACCVVTGGAAGCWYSERGGEVHHVAAMQVLAVDTTGCGDVFHGAYAVGLAEGRSVEHSIRFATVAAGLKASRSGGRSAIPDRQEVDRAFRAMFKAASGHAIL
jgi:sulfofructose kinase